MDPYMENINDYGRIIDKTMIKFATRGNTVRLNDS